jgi:hypothetical protein
MSKCNVCLENFNSRRWKIKDDWKNKPGGMINSAYNRISE